MAAPERPNGMEVIKHNIAIVVLAISAVAGYVTMQNQVSDLSKKSTALGNIDEKLAVIRKDIFADEEKMETAINNLVQTFNKDLQRLDEKATINVEKHEERPHKDAVSDKEHAELKTEVGELEDRFDTLVSEFTFLKGQFSIQPEVPSRGVTRLYTPETNP